MRSPFDDWVFARFRWALANLPANLTKEQVTRPELLLRDEGPLSIYYAPFDYVNEHARVVLMGITPGRYQMFVACSFVRDQLAKGVPDQQVLKDVKSKASFSGPMRQNLLSMLDGIGLPAALGIGTSASLFDQDAGLLFSTSAVSFPVFVRDDNYTGSSPAILGQEILCEIARQVFVSRINRIPEALVIPLGKAASSVAELLVREGLVDGRRFLMGFPHPSGGNGHRVREYRENLSRLRNGITTFFAAPSASISFPAMKT